jgi:Family of unknown function (DUF6941)
MRVTMMLADAAQAVAGKLYVLGGGWSIVGPEPMPMAIALKIDVPWDSANRRHTLRLVLVDDDDQPVVVPTPTGERAVELSADFEVGRPPGTKPGTDLDVVFGVNILPMPLKTDSRYVWRCHIDDQTREEWQVRFTTRSATTPRS